MAKLRTLDELRKEFERDNFPACGFVRITPEIAASILERHDTNRRTRAEIIQRYGNDMLNDLWVHTSGGIGFDRLGRLTNGQHRLWACFNSGASFEVLVVYGLPVHSQDAEDDVVKRTASDTFRLNGIANATVLSAAVGWLASYETTDGLHTSRHSRGISHKNALKVLSENPHLADHAGQYQTTPRNLVSSSAIVWLRYETDRIDPELSRTFWDTVLTGAIPEDTDRMASALLLRDRLLRSYGGKAIDAHDKVRLCVLAWNRVYENGTQPGRLVMPDGILQISGRAGD